jgi:hypothetical protein
MTSLVPAADVVTVVPEKSLRDARQPQAAVDPAGRIFIAYGSGDGIYCSVSTDGGKSYAGPVKVGEVAKLGLGKRRGPRVAATEKAIVITAQGHRDNNVLAFRSTDAGKTWKGPVTINSVSGSAPEGLHALAAGPDGTVYCVWLDLREKKGQQVYGAASTDGGATWQQERLIYASPDEGVCPCCQPVVNYDLKGGLHVMWRNDLAGNRDMWLISSTDNGKSFGKAAKLGDGSWSLAT